MPANSWKLNYRNNHKKENEIIITTRADNGHAHNHGKNYTIWGKDAHGKWKEERERKEQREKFA